MLKKMILKIFIYMKWILDISLSPPYTYICLIAIKSKDYEKASKTSTSIKKYLEPRVDSKTVIYGPTPASVFKINNIYTFQITIKYTFDDKLKDTLKGLENLYNSDHNVNLEITFNPSRF